MFPETVEDDEVFCPDCFAGMESPEHLGRCLDDDDPYVTPPDSLPVYHSGKVHIKAEMCVTCVFRPGNLMNLNPGRLKDLVDENLKNGAAITCHKTTFGQAKQEATCRGFYDAYGEQVQAFRLAKAMDMIKEVE